MGIQYVGWTISAISVGYLIYTLVRPVIVGDRLRITLPWHPARIGGEAVVINRGKRIAATVIATGGDLLLPGGWVCCLPPEGAPAADIVYGALAELPEVIEVPIDHICICHNGITTIVPLKARVGAILI